MIDASKGNNILGTNRHVVDIVRATLDESQLAEVSLAFRKMKDQFSEDNNIKHINAELAKTSGDITDKELSVSLDTMSKSGWDSGIVPHLNTIPLMLAGKGEQSMIKIKLAMQKAAENNIFLIEEPENHLSFPNLNNLIAKIKEQSQSRQLIITTHSSFVLNKLGVENVLFFNGIGCMTLKDLEQSTHDYFMKLPGHDTLRLILAKQAILVEGPSDELIVQKAFLKKYEKMPLELGIDVITVASLAFKRFLEIAAKLNINVKVITDNDENVEALQRKYSEFLPYPNIQICYDDDEKYPTLEPQLLKANNLNTLNTLNKALGKHFKLDEELLSYMDKNKTECALKLFNTNEPFNIPEYIQYAIT
ncbi:MAG: TOPRIM nucleotidyl transferase/hydrolase domain-containing protein [Chloroflexota bacterium]